MADQIVVLLRQLKRLTGIGLHRSVAHQRRFVIEHVHVGQDRNQQPVGQVAETVPRRADLGQPRRPRGQQVDLVQVLVDLVEITDIFVIGHARQIHDRPFIHVRRDAVGQGRIQLHRILHLPDIRGVDVEHVLRHPAVIQADGRLIAFQQGPFQIDVLTAVRNPGTRWLGSIG